MDRWWKCPICFHMNECFAEIEPGDALVCVGCEATFDVKREILSDEEDHGSI